ncbi:MAG TPA: hypothetical protein VHT91_06145 [Kofleriaceae bacterium]|nr:hypothetical protein [Kofleriaceae bacterium]
MTPGEHPAEVAHEQKISAATLAGGSSLELIGGGAAAVLAIIGLAGTLPFYMTTIATIVVGGALLAHGAAVTARRTDTMRSAEDRAERIEIGGGAGSEFLGGAGAIVLGILALAGVMPGVLLPVAMIVVGATILLGAPAQPEIARLAPDRDRRMSRITHEAVEGASGGMVLAGLGAIVLGILALIGVGPVSTLVQVSLLAVGVALLLSGSALTARFGRRLQQLT